VGVLLVLSRAILDGPIGRHVNEMFHSSHESSNLFVKSVVAKDSFERGLQLQPKGLIEEGRRLDKANILARLGKVKGDEIL